MDVFITGATGFIGKKLIDYISNDKRFDSIYCLSRKKNFFSSAINVMSGSLDDLHNMPVIKVDVCIHLAAITDSSLNDKKDVFRTNAEGTEKVIEFCKRSGIQRIIFISSVNVYLKKKYTYALSKLYAEDCIKNSGLKYSVIRCSLVYGNGCPSFNKIIRYADLFHMVPILGPGKSYKQPIYIDEVCEDIIRCTFSMAENTVYDLYGKTKLTYNEMVKVILATSGKKALLLHLPVKPFLVMSELCYKYNIPFPVSPEQISHMCEDLCSHTDIDSARSDEFFNNVCKYI